PLFLSACVEWRADRPPPARPDSVAPAPILQCRERNSERDREALLGQPWVKHLFADGPYDRLKLMDKAAYLDFVVEIIRRSDDQKGFQVLPLRWVVERTFGWMTRGRRLVR